MHASSLEITQPAPSLLWASIFQLVECKLYPLPSALRSHPVCLPVSALVSAWAQYLSGPLLQKPSTVFGSGLPIFTPPTPSCLPSSSVLCMLWFLPSALEEVMGEEGEGWDQPASGCSSLETSAVCRYARVTKRCQDAVTFRR